MNSNRAESAAIQPEWEDRIPEEEWALYREVIQRARSKGIQFAFGGAFATALYTGELRNTKDFDLYLLPADRDRMIQAMEEARLSDHYSRLSYDQSWIYRGSRDDIIVDAIWAMANHRAAVDESWLQRGPEVSIRGERLRAIPPEELIWSKLYVLQRERCDWTDIFNLLEARVDRLDWEHLLLRVGADEPLLEGAMRVFCWVAPDRVAAIPGSVRTRLGLPEPNGPVAPELSLERARLLDTRPWFIRHIR
jgi:hypothetical protein